jgi:hypothetical protein
MELEIKGKVYSFKMTLGTIKAMNQRYHIVQDGITLNTGIQQTSMGLFMRDPEALGNLLLDANLGQSPRLTEKVLEAYLDDEDVDIEDLYQKAEGLLEKSNLTKKQFAAMKEAMKEVQA